MSEEPKEFNARYIETVANAQLRQVSKKQFNPRIPYTYFVGQTVLGPSKGNVPYYPWAIVFDNDGVLTVGDEDKKEEGVFKTIYYGWKSALAEINGRLKRAADTIETYIKRMEFCTGDFEEEQKRVTNELIEAGLTEEDYKLTTRIGAERATLAPGALETVLRLEELGIVSTQCSGSPQESVEFVGAQRLTIPPYLSEGTRFIFHKGKLIDSYSNVASHKVKSKARTLRKIGCSTEVLVSDTGYRKKDGSLGDAVVFMNAGLGDLCMWVQRKGWIEKIPDFWKSLLGEDTDYKVDIDEKLMPGKINIASEKFAEDLTYIIRPIEIWRRARLVTLFYEPNFYLSIVNDARVLKQTAERSRSAASEKFVAYRDRVLETGRRLRRNLDFVFPDISSDLDGHLSQLLAETVRDEPDIERQKSLIEQIKIDFEEATAEIHFDERDVARIRDIAEDFKSRFPKFEARRYV